MINSFSERESIIKSVNLNPKEMPTGLRNRFWNIIQKYISDSFSQPNRDKIIKYIWDRFFKEDVDILIFRSYYGYTLDQIKEKFYKFEWNRVYDFLEFLLNLEAPQYQKNALIHDLNSVFIDEGAKYKVINGIITSLISKEEAEEVRKAIESKYAPVSTHFKKALELYSKRPNPDYKNSIKESISAVEALVRIILNKPNGTLGALVEQLNIHSAFKEGINKLYGWTSDEGGIRHAEKEKGLKIDEKEARFMLIQCSALVNYIISKSES